MHLLHFGKFTKLEREISRKQIGCNIVEFKISVRSDPVVQTSEVSTRNVIQNIGILGIVNSLLYLMLSGEISLLGASTLLILGAALFLALRNKNSVKEEILLVIEDLGIQLCCKYQNGKEEIQFYDKARIKGVFINEGITLHRVIFYLAFVMERHSKMVVAFQHLNPKLEVLQEIYRCTRSMLFENYSAGASAKGMDKVSMM
mmetsp:Transcript_17029/g.22150  ORF Transcript_17029/g.22150 Transcript_17029/m.22150 type:complete len:202 (+) Transcript_17029:72-677(+)